MKQKLNIQTREEFENPRYIYWRHKEEDKQVEKMDISSEIKRLKFKISSLKEKRSQIKKQTFKQYCEENTYEDWVRCVRARNDNRFEIIENEDSKEVI